jgi:hypothetical protein
LARQSGTGFAVGVAALEMNAPFLTEVDPEIAVKGSMDHPLGLLPLWSRYGRRVVGNLTLVASSARGFTT